MTKVTIRLVGGKWWVLADELGAIRNRCFNELWLAQYWMEANYPHVKYTIENPEEN